ncbi:hypothetical protein AURDEDRAFT_111558 [Auricularia subglabra TFB-10046 SS5]|nr:hypothetical protein AURDEDRAFT_111558 [Auricularia subglabra TFB-10046 SS5]
MIRVCAIYHHSRRVRFVVLGGAVVEVVAVLALGLRIVLSAEWTPVLIAGVRSCAPGGVFPSWRWVFWITPLVYYCILFVLVVKGAHWTRGQSKDWKVSSSRALRLIVRDSTINFVYNLAIQTAYIFIWRFGRTGLMQVPTFIAFSLDIIFATKLLLNLWERFYRDEVHDGTPSPTFALNTYSLVRKPLRDDDDNSNAAARRAVHVEESFWGIKDSDEENGTGRTAEEDGLDVLRRLMTG